MGASVAGSTTSSRAGRPDSSWESVCVRLCRRALCVTSRLETAVKPFDSRLMSK